MSSGLFSPRFTSDADDYVDHRRCCRRHGLCHVVGVKTA